MQFRYDDDNDDDVDVDNCINIAINSILIFIYKLDCRMFTEEYIFE